MKRPRGRASAASTTTDAEGMPAVSVEGSSKTYPGRDTSALDGVSLTVERGEILGLLGPNGAGKSTLVGCATTPVVPTAGQVRIAGVDVAVPCSTHGSTRGVSVGRSRRGVSYGTSRSGACIEQATGQRCRSKVLSPATHGRENAKRGPSGTNRLSPTGRTCPLGPQAAGC